MRRVEPAGWVALLILGGVWAWWGAKEGAYFGAVLYPGIVVLCAGFVLISSRTALDARLQLPGPAKLVLGALLALAAWSALSAFWTPAPDVAIADAQRIAGYALAFGLGIWLVTLVGDRLHLALVPLAFAGLVAGVVAVAGMLTVDNYAKLVDGGTLQFPIGYRNANAAFFLIAVWPAVALASTRELDWRLRALAIGTATLCIEIALLSQSRGSVIAAAVALGVFVAISPDRARGVAWLALAAAASLIVIPAVTDLYQAGSDEAYSGLGEIRSAGRAALAGALTAAAIGAAAALAGRRISPSAERAASANRAVAIGAVGLVLAGTAGFAVVTGDPAGWIGDRVDEFLTQGTPGSEGRSSRFGVSAGTERDELWRVALDDFGDDPLAGTGAGGYQYSYLQKRAEDSPDAVRDAHSVELEVLSELGLPGLALFVLAIGAAVVAAWRARRAGPYAAAVSAVALTAGAYWLAHSSLDWFWTYAAVTAPVFGLLGSAAAAGSSRDESASAGRARVGAAVAAALLAASVVAPFLAERYVQAAYEGWRSDPEEAQTHLDRARSLNRLSIEPLLAEGGIARERGNREQAIAAFGEAAEERPEDWAAHYFLAELELRSDPAAARAHLDTALELNPYGIELLRLAQRLED